MNPQERQAALERFERAVERPLLILALVLVPLLIIPLLVELPSGLETMITAGGWFIWASFAVEYLVRLSLADKRRQFVRRQWPALLTVLLPFLRPLGVLRSTRTLRVLRLSRVLARLGGRR